LRHDEVLVEIVYPEDAFTGEDGAADERRLARPTFLDGGARAIYRSMDGGEDHWGRAVDLETLDEGWPEAVHPKIAFSEHFQVRFLGVPGPRRSTYSTSDLLQRMPRRYSEDEQHRLLVYLDA
jgi:hypothetical protein